MSWPFWMAHRGAGTTAPENTLAAFRTGLAAGFRAFECDVQLSADGVPFLLHDDRLDRTSTGSGLACARPWAALSQLDAGRWHSPAWAGEPICSLAALAALAEAQQLAINLELKPSPREATRVGAGVAAWLRQHWRGPAPRLSSFEPEALRAAGPAFERALLLEHWTPEAPRQAQALGCQGVVCHHASLQAEGIAALHAAGLQAFSYTVNEGAEARRLVSAGIDGLITDRLDLPDVVPAPRRI
jgi:glycerophosphoryl diester phosphodiesterase